MLTLLAGMASISLTAQNPAESTAKRELKGDAQVLQEVYPASKETGSDVQLRATPQAWPDSTVSFTLEGERSRKTVYTYHASGRRTLTETFAWENNRWVNAAKTVPTYDAAGRQTRSESYKWENNEWVNTEKSAYEYNAAGNRTLSEWYKWENNVWVGQSKYTYEYDASGQQISSKEYKWENNQWTLEKTVLTPPASTANAKVYVTEELRGDMTIVYLRTPWWYAWYGFGGQKYDVKYDAKGNLVYLETYSLDENNQRYIAMNAIVTYDNNNFTVEISNHGILRIKWIYEYDTFGNVTLFEYYEWDDTKKQWIVHTKSIDSYDATGRHLFGENYEGDKESNTWIPTYRNATVYDVNGKPSYEYYKWDAASNSWAGESKNIYKTDEEGNTSISHDYTWENNKWALSGYTIYYPIRAVSDLDVPSAPVGADNKGILEFGLSIPSDATITGSFTVQFPEGITLDNGGTALTSELSDDFDLVITPKANNTWQIEIRSKTLRAGTETGVFKKIMNIAYTVNANLKQGAYTATISQVNLELNDGTRIIEEHIPVTLDVARYGTHNEWLETASVQAYADGNLLTVRSDVAETIEVYLLTGQRIFSVNKPAGEYRFDVRSIPQGVVIVKGSAGWAKKVVR
jgi:hypothetical protein